jgi:Cellulose binding domain
VPGQGAEPPVEDVLAERRYAELDGWSQSAETVTMPAVAPDPYPAAPRRRLVVAASEIVTEPPSSALHEHSDLSRTPPARPARRRVAVLAGAGLAVLLLGGGVVALAGGDAEPPVAGVPVTAGVVTTAAEEHPVRTDEPVTTESVRSTGPSAPPSPSRSAEPSASPPGTTAPVVKVGHGTRPIMRAPTAGPTRTTPPPEPSLSAVYHYDDAGHSGSVQVVNSGNGAATGWTVTLTVAGAETVSVSSGAVSVSQSGSVVTFRPAGGTVPAGGSVSFGFSLDEEPASAPGGCAIDGVACS